MALLVIGLLLNSLAAMSVGFNGEVGTLFPTIMMGFWAVSMVGLVLILGGQKKPGAILVFIGAIAYVPLGLVAVFGARKVLEAARRPAANPA